MGLLSRRGRAHPESIQGAENSPAGGHESTAAGSKPHSKLAAGAVPPADAENSVDADNIGFIITPRGSISSCDGQPLSPNRRLAQPQPPPAAAGRMVDLSGCSDGAPLVIPAAQPADPAALDALVASMLEAQGEKGAVRARVFALPPEHKWALLCNYKTLQQNQAAASGGGGSAGGPGVGGGAEDEPEAWVRALEMQPELDALQHLAVLLRTLPLQ